MDFILQILGGGFYLLSKIFLAAAEGRKENLKRKLRIVGWSTYMLGLPPIVWLFVLKHRWIAAFLEAGGGPAMLLGLILTIRRLKKEKMPLWLRYLEYFAFLTALVGAGISFWEYGSLGTKEQAMEFGLVVGYLAGTYILGSMDSPWGFICFMGMNICCGILMYWDDRMIMVGQQVLSFCISGYGAYRGFFASPRQTE